MNYDHLSISGFGDFDHKHRDGFQKIADALGVELSKKGKFDVEGYKFNFFFDDEIFLPLSDSIPGIVALLFVLHGNTIGRTPEYPDEEDPYIWNTIVFGEKSYADQFGSVMLEDGADGSDGALAPVTDLWVTAFEAYIKIFGNASDVLIIEGGKTVPATLELLRASI